MGPILEVPALTDELAMIVSQTPNSDKQPAPQYSSVFPQAPYWLQHDPNMIPSQIPAEAPQ